MKLPSAYIQASCQYKEYQQKYKKKTPMVQLLQFLTNKFHGICHFLSKNSDHFAWQLSVQVSPAFARRQYGFATQQ